MPKLKYETIEAILGCAEDARANTDVGERGTALTWARKHCQALATHLVTTRRWSDATRACDIAADLDSEAAECFAEEDAEAAMFQAGFVDGQLRLYNDDAPGALLLTAVYCPVDHEVSVYAHPRGVGEILLYRGDHAGLDTLFRSHVHGKE